MKIPTKKGNGLKDKANIQELKGMPMFVGNVTSHDNEFTESIEDLAVKRWPGLFGQSKAIYK